MIIRVWNFLKNKVNLKQQSRSSQGLMSLLTLKCKDREIQEAVHDQLQNHTFQSAGLFLIISTVSLIRGMIKYKQEQNSKYFTLQILTLFYFISYLIWIILIWIGRFKRVTSFGPWIVKILGALLLMLIINNFVPMLEKIDYATLIELQIMTQIYVLVTVLFAFNDFKMTLFIGVPLAAICKMQVTRIKQQLQIQEGMISAEEAEDILETIPHVIQAAFMIFTIALQNYLFQKRMTELVIQERTSNRQQNQIQNLFMSQPEGIIVYQSQSKVSENSEKSQLERNDNENQQTQKGPQSDQIQNENQVQQERFNIKLCNNSVQELIHLTPEQLQNNQSNKYSQVTFKLQSKAPFQESRIKNELSQYEKLKDSEFQYFPFSRIMSQPTILGPNSQQLVILQEKQFCEQIESQKSQFSLESQNTDKILLVHHSQIIYDNEVCQIITIRDLTQQQQLRQALKEMKLLEHLNATVSHEMMTPLNCLITFVNNIIQNSKEKFVIDQSLVILKIIQLLKFNARDLVDRQILLNQEVGNSQMILDIQEHNVAELINQVKEIMQYQAQPKNIEIALNLHQELKENTYMLDGIRFQQILTNLISNAIKFSRQNEPIMIKTLKSPSKHILDGIQIKIIDYGIGIPKSDQANIFKHFFKSNSQEHQKMNAYGNGLGLSICKLITEKMNGEISFESQVNCGSCFQLEFNFPSSSKLKTKKDNQSSFNGMSFSQIAENVKQLNNKSNFVDSFKNRCLTQKFEQKQILNSLNQNKQVQHSDIQKELIQFYEFNQDKVANQPQKKSPNKNDSYENDKNNKPLVKTRQHSSMSRVQQMIQYYDLPEEFNQSQHSVDANLLLIADDKQIVIDSIRLQLEIIDLLPVSEFFANGQQVIDRVQDLLHQKIDNSQNQDQLQSIRPVAAIIVDFQMPIKNGLQVIAEIKDHFQKINTQMELDKSFSNEGTEEWEYKTKFQEPLYIIMSSFVTANNEFENHCLQSGADRFYPKPLELEQITEIQQLMNSQ